MKTQKSILVAAIAVVALWGRPTTIWADNAASAPSETATSGGASVGSPTNETPKITGHAQENSLTAPAAQGSLEKGERNPTAASSSGGEAGKPEGRTVPGTSTGASVGSPTLETPKPEGHGNEGSNAAPVAKPDDRK